MVAVGATGAETDAVRATGAESGAVRTACVGPLAGGPASGRDVFPDGGDEREQVAIPDRVPARREGHVERQVRREARDVSDVALVGDDSSRRT